MPWPALKRLLRLVGAVYREALYLSMEEEHRSSRARLVRRTRLELLGYAAYSTAIAITTSAFSAIPLVMRGPGVPLEGAVRASALIYTTSLLAFTFMLSSSSAWMAQEHRLFEPLRPLPLRKRDIQLVMALVASADVLPMAIAPLVYGVLSALALGSAPAGAVGVLYGYVSLIIAMGGALSLSSLISRRVSGASVRARVARALSTTTFIACLAMALLASQLVDALALHALGPTGAGAPASLTWLLYPFSVGEGMLLALSPEGVAEAATLALAYLALSACLFRKGLSRYWASLAGCSPRLGGPSGAGARAPPILDPSIGILIKDLKLFYRDPRAYYTLVAPAIAHVALFTIALKVGGLPPHIVGFSYGLLGILMGMVSYQLMGAEGGMFWFLFSSGLSRRDLALGKALACSLAYAACAMPLNILLSCCLSEPYYAAYAASSALLGFSASAVCARYLAELVEPEDKALRLAKTDDLFVACVLLALLVPYCLALIMPDLLAVLLVALAEAITCLIAAAW